MDRFRRDCVVAGCSDEGPFTWACSRSRVRFRGSWEFSGGGSNPRSEPVSMTRWRAAPDQAHIRSPRVAAAPTSRVRRVGSGGRDHTDCRLLRPMDLSVRPPGSAGLLGPCDWSIGQIVTGFITAPSMTTPAVVYRHRATRSLRARATIIVLRVRPPRRPTRSWNHRLSAAAAGIKNERYPAE